MVSLKRRDYAVGSLGGLLLCLLSFVAFGAMEFVREGVRKPYIVEHFKLASVPTHAQWSSFWLFAVIFLLGLALAAYTVRLAFPSSRAPATAAESAGG